MFLVHDTQVQKLHALGERSGLATAVMEHAHAMIQLANALYIRKQFDEAKVGQLEFYTRETENFFLHMMVSGEGEGGGDARVLHAWCCKGMHSECMTTACCMTTA